ncbi:MAG: hypothetical protein K2X50_09735 [Gammaproteobacteria bacterium]|nr:hypothetical protein [Gammaproteobacteria bacterium]
MKKMTFAALLFVISTQAVFANTAPSSMSPPSAGSGTIQAMPKLERPVEKKQTEEPMPSITRAPQLTAKHASYFFPGIIVYRGGKWEGSDHLLNLTNNIGLYISIVKPHDVTLDISEEHLKKAVADIFDKVNIKPTTLAPEGKPPLPAFEIEILIYPIERGYVACCSGSLFESVTLQRFVLDQNMAFQAITWQKETLVVSPTEKFAEQLTSSVQEIGQAFADRFETFDKMKK